MIGPKVVLSVFRAGLRSLSPIAKYPLCDAVDVRTVEDQQFDPDDVTGQSADGDAAAEAAAASVETQLAEPGCAEAYWPATGTAESRGAGAGRTVPAAAGLAAWSRWPASCLKCGGGVSELVGGAYVLDVSTPAPISSNRPARM
jgi:hypothetical protein